MSISKWNNASAHILHNQSHQLQISLKLAAHVSAKHLTTGRGIDLSSRASCRFLFVYGFAPSPGGLPSQPPGLVNQERNGNSDTSNIHSWRNLVLHCSRRFVHLGVQMNNLPKKPETETKVAIKSKKYSIKQHQLYLMIFLVVIFSLVGLSAFASPSTKWKKEVDDWWVSIFTRQSYAYKLIEENGVYPLQNASIEIPLQR